MGTATLSHEDRVCLALGKEIVLMIGELKSAPDDAAYTRRRLTYRGGGSIELLLASSPAVASAMEKGVAS